MHGTFLDAECGIIDTKDMALPPMVLIDRPLALPSDVAEAPMGIVENHEESDDDNETSRKIIFQGFIDSL
jgi:hypothetical protein